jgi:hypothetical protein
MIGNSRIPGIATERAQRLRELENQAANGAHDIANRAIGELSKATTYVIEACDPGEYSETALPNLLWAYEAAVTALQPVERHLKAVA